MFRIIQSIPSPKAEPFKRWLAKVGYERVQEIEDPELASKRAKTLYKLKGYPENWIEKRMRGIAVRNELTDEWDKRGAERQKDYEILTAEISKATFGVIPSDYKKLKGIYFGMVIGFGYLSKAFNLFFLSFIFTLVVLIELFVRKEKRKENLILFGIAAGVALIIFAP